jgi:hypothetical protein
MERHIIGLFVVLWGLVPQDDSVMFDLVVDPAAWVLGHLSNHLCPLVML